MIGFRERERSRHNQRKEKNIMHIGENKKKYPKGLNNMFVKKLTRQSIIFYLSVTVPVTIQIRFATVRGFIIKGL
jgi:hypothetical protein